MKKFILAAIAATLVSTPALAAPAQRHNDRVVVKTVKVKPHQTVIKRKVVKAKPGQAQYRNQHGNQYGNQYRKWTKGQRFDSHYARNYREIRTPRNYRLYDAPRGYHWVQSGNDAVLVGITSGIIGAVIAGILN